MKKHLILAVLLLAAVGIKAQQGEIIYTDFEPDTMVELKQIDLYPESRMNLDFDGDGLFDVRIFENANSGGFWYYIFSNSTEWGIHEYEVGDTLSPMNEQEGWTPRMYWMPYFFQGQSTMSERFAVRHAVGDTYYYGWFRAYLVFNSQSSWPWVAVDNMAFCTIPDYPLVWGQTTLTESVDEIGPSAFATVHPNPTTGMVTVTGKSLRQAEVFNMLGQLVFSAQGNGDELQINMASLPAGVYFVTVTDEEGRRCVRKVVRE